MSSLDNTQYRNIRFKNPELYHSRPEIKIRLSSYREEIENSITKGKVPTFGYPLIDFEENLHKHNSVCEYSHIN